MNANLKLLFKLLLCVSMLLVTTKLFAQTSQRLSVPVSVEKWITTTFAKGKVPPFSFVYDGKNSAGFIRKWKHSITRVESDAEGVVRYDVCYVDSVSGLEVRCEISGFKDFGAVEWLLHITNRSKVNSGQITQLRSVDFTMHSATSGEFKVLHAKGSNGARADFMPILKVVDAGTELALSPTHGRSSDTSAFPFFNIIAPDGSGAVVAIGWSGTWLATMACDDDRSITLAAAMKNFDLHLYPDESIRSPRVAMLFWQGDDYMSGQNKFRQFILAHHTYKVDGSYGHSPLCGGFDWGDPSPCNEYSCLTEEYAVALIKRHKQFGITPEVFWLDAGWYDGCGALNARGNWYNMVGNWQVDRERFPRGLKPLSDAAHALGAKFMVWFEPERVCPGTLFAELHPEWMLKTPSNKHMLYNLGDKQALDWLCQYIGDFIEENGIDYYRQDFNMAIAPFWEANDKAGRVGICEIRHIEGLYAYWDYLLERFPGLVIDNCASGGRRIDLETMSRSIPLWRTDYSYGEPNGYQCHTYGLNLFLPLHGTGVYKSDYYSFLSSMSSATVMNWPLTTQGEKIGGMQRVVREFKELRPYYMEDYYPLTGICDLTGDDVWLAYQLHRKSDDSGIIVAFRRPNCPTESCDVKLKGLLFDATYEIHNIVEDVKYTMSGGELMEQLTLQIAQPRGALLLQYKIIK